MRWHGLNIDEVKSCVFEYSWSDLMCILNIQKVPSWVILNIHEAKSWVLWIFMKWRHGHFECSKADVKCKYSWMTSCVFKSWRHGHSEYLWGDIGILNTKWRYGIIQKLTPWVFWIFIVTLFNIHSKLRRFLSIHSNDVTPRILKLPMSLWIFKIPMTALCE